MREEKRTDIGLLIILVGGLAFWSCVGITVSYLKAYNARYSVNPGPVCADLRAGGWDVQQSECVQALLSE